MQSLLAFCSICLQLSNFADLTNELVLKRDEACTLCLTDMFQPINPVSNRSTTEILSDGLYFNNPLLKEALKLKLEQQILVQTGGCVDNIHPQEPLIFDIAGLEEAKRLLDAFEKRLEGLPSSKRQIREGFNTQRDSFNARIQEKVDLAKAIWIHANTNRANRRELPKHLKDLVPAIDKIKKEFTGTIIPDQRDDKLSRFSSKYFDDLRSIKQKVQESKGKIIQAFNPQDFQELSLIYNKTILSLEQHSKLFHQFDPEPILMDLDQRLKSITDQLEEYLKPIRTSLKAGEILAAKDRITSENGVYSLILHEKWEFAIYQFSKVIWRSAIFSSSSEPPQLILDPVDGVFKIQDANATFVKSISPENPNYTGKGAYLTITNSGELRIVASGLELWTPLFAIPPAQMIESPEKYTQMTPLVSENEIYTLLLTEECFLVLFEHAKPIWAHNLHPKEEIIRQYRCELQLKGDGSLGRIPSLHLLWGLGFLLKHSPETGKVSLIVKNDGTLAVLSQDQEMWTSKNQLHKE